MDPKQVDSALAALLNDAMKRVEAHDSKLDPQGYAALVGAVQSLAYALVRNEGREVQAQHIPGTGVTQGSLLGEIMPSATIGKESW